MDRVFKLEPLIPLKLIKQNDLKEVSNPVFFNGNGGPTSDGLLSNEIFGITKEERSGSYAYISLGNEIFMHPLHYKLWSSIDSKIKEIVHGVKTFKVNSKGEFEEDPDGENGIKFLQKNISKIKFKSTDSNRRDRKIIFLEQNKNSMFISQLIVIPAFYRDVNSTEGKMGVGDINKLYNSLIIAVRSLTESADYGLNMSNSVRGRVQEIILQIYSWFADGGESNPSLAGGVGISKKKGILRRANLSKTTDYSSRLVISAPNLKVETMDDLIVDFDHSALPLASAIVNFYPFIVFWVRSFFEQQFSGNAKYAIRNKKGEVEYIDVLDYQIAFSDARIKKEMDRFIRGRSNRFIPIPIPNKDKRNITMRFIGQAPIDKIVKDTSGEMSIVERDLTWCDLFYRAAVEMTKDKMILITRYPIDSIYNQFTTKVVISSTKETEPMVIEGITYNHYPKIRSEMIGSDTSNAFIDTFILNNTYLGMIGGDYDGDQVSVKGIFTREANAELEKQLNSKSHYVSLNGTSIVQSHHEAIQSIYSLTNVLSGTKLTDPIF